MNRLFELSTDVLSLLEPAEVVRLDTAATAGTEFEVDAVGFADIATFRLAPPVVDVPADGLALPFDWGVPPAGTDRVELAPLTVEVQADTASDFGGYPLGELAVKDGGGELTVTAPGGRRIRALHLGGLKSEGVAFSSEQQLADAGRRLIVSVRDANDAWAAPVVAVPAVGRRNKVPPTLTGATFANGVLRVPDLVGPLRLAIVEHDSPADFTVHAATVATVSGWAAPTPVDLTLLGPDGATLWAFPGPMPDTVVQAADVSVAVAAAVEQQRAAGATIAGSLRLTSRFPCKVGFRLSSIAGDLVRALPGTTAVELAGEAVAFPLAAPLPQAAPARVIADVKVAYRGIRLADVSDAMPPSGAHRGVVVRQDRVLRTLAPLALRGERVCRIGLVGYCPEPAALLVRLVAADGSAQVVGGSTAVPGLGSPGTANVDAATSVGVVWVDLPEPVQLDRPAAIEVSAGSGRFHWVTDPDPLVRIVVLDPDPGRRPIVLGGVTLLTVDQPALGAARAVLPAAAFAGQAPLVASALFCTLEVTDAQLRYPRGGVMATFVAEINGLDLTAIDVALGRARDAMQRAQQLSLGDLDPTALLGDLGPAIGAAVEVQADATQLEELGREALDALGGLVGLPDLSGVEDVLGGLDALTERLSIVAEVFGGGDGAVLDRIFRALSGSLDLDTLLREITDRASKVLGVTIPEEYRRPIESLGALARTPQPGELLDILGSVLVGLDLADVNRFLASANRTLELVATAGDVVPLDAAIAVVRARLDVAYTLMEAPAVEVDALLTAIADVGAAVDGAAVVVSGFAAGLATDLRTSANTLPALDLTTRLDGWIAALPLPGEDIPLMLVESLEGMAEALEQVDGAAVTAALAAMKDELVQASGLDRLADLLAGLDTMFDEAGAMLDRLPVRKLRDDAVAALVDVQQAVLTFDGFDFLDAGVAPIRELDAKIRALDPSSVTDAVDTLVTQLNGLLSDVDLAPVRAAVDTVIGPLGEIVDRLVPFVQEVATQLAQVVDELNGIDVEVAGTATLDLMHGIRAQVADAVGGGDVPPPVAAAVAAAAAVLRELDLAAELDAPFAHAAASIDIGGLIEPIEEIWRVAGDALKKATPAALIAELDPPFDELLGALDALSLQPLIDALQRVFDDLVVQLGRADPRTLVAPLEAAFQEVVRTITATLDPAPLFAPLRAVYQALRELLDRIDIEATLQGVLGGLADLPGQLTTRLGTQLQAGVSGSPTPIPAAAGTFELGDVLRPLALFLAEVRSRLAALAGGVLGPVLAELAAATRGLRALTDPETGFAVHLGDALDARLAWLDPDAADGPLATLRTDLESFRMAVADLQVSAPASARLAASADGVQFSARVDLSAAADVAPHAGRLRATSDSADLGRSLRLLARALDAALPTELLTGTLDPIAATDAFLDAVFDRIDPTDLADRLDAVGGRIELRFVALADELAAGLFLLVDALFDSIEPLMPATVIARLQAGLDGVLARFEVLDPAPIEEEVRAVVRAAISLLAVHSPAALAAELGAVFDSCITQVRALSPETLFAGADPFAAIRAQLETLRPSVVLADLVPRTAQFTAALDTIGTIDLEFAVAVVADLRAAFEAVLEGVQREWNALLDELSEISVSASGSVG